MARTFEFVLQFVGCVTVTVSPNQIIIYYYYYICLFIHSTPYQHYTHCTVHLFCFPTPAGDPICEVVLNGKKVNNTGVNDVVENDIVGMVCKIRIWGDWVPTMRWQVNGEQVGDNNTKTHHDNSSVSSAITLVIISNIFSQSTVQVSCLTHFTLGNKPKSKSASNIPDYHHTWVAPPLMIKKGQSLKLSCGSKLSFL